MLETGIAEVKGKFGGEGLSDQFDIQAEQKGRLHQVVCSRAGNEAGDWTWKRQRRGEDPH